MRRTQAPSQPELIGDAALHRLSKRHQSSPNMIRVRVQNYGVGNFDEDTAAVDLL
jgi:hypothetical protein